MRKVLAIIAVLGLASFAFAADANKTVAKVEKKAEHKAEKNTTKKAAHKAEKKEVNATK